MFSRRTRFWSGLWHFQTLAHSILLVFNNMFLFLSELQRYWGHRATAYTYNIICTQRNPLANIKTRRLLCKSYYNVDNNTYVSNRRKKLSSRNIWIIVPITSKYKKNMCVQVGTSRDLLVVYRTIFFYCTCGLYIENRYKLLLYILCTRRTECIM